MTTCRLYGGLGNQLFIIAATIGLSIKNNTNYKIPQFTIDEKNRKAVFKHFPVLKDEEIKYIYKEPAFHYQEIPYKDGICIDGYFQSEKYFGHCKNVIYNAFGFYYEMLDGVVSVHVRRGDYLLYPQYHPALTMEYYTKAINFFIDKRYKHYLVFSDDINWCKNNLNVENFPSCYFEYSENNNALEDMQLQASCEHNIIANSSFSWWAAYLNKNIDKIVISPKIWFGPLAKNDIRDLLPEKWLQF